jgi:hypothetical protein
MSNRLYRGPNPDLPIPDHKYEPLLPQFSSVQLRSAGMGVISLDSHC